MINRAAEKAREAAEAAGAGDWPRALRAAKEAESEERAYGDAPAYRPLVTAIREAAHEASWDAAVDGLSIRRAAGYVRVRDEQDTWYCAESDWDDVRASWDLVLNTDVEDAGACAYDALCGRIPAIHSRIGTCYGTPDEQAEMFRALVDARELDVNDVPDGVAPRGESHAR